MYSTLHKFSAWLSQKSRSNLLLLLLFIFTPVFSGFIFPYFRTLYGLDNHTFLDVQFGFTPEYARALVESYGDYGRKGVAFITGIIDSIYPFVYGLFLALVISRLRIKSSRLKSSQLLNLLPFVAMVFDFIENTGILLMINIHPAQNASIANISSFAGIMKWLVLGCCILIILYLLIRRCKKSK